MASDDGQKERQEGKGIVVMKEYSSSSSQSITAPTLTDTRQLRWLRPETVLCSKAL